MIKSHISPYYDLKKVADGVRKGSHRGLIGGMWDEIGRLQFDFVKGRGLSPDMRVIDIGCGCLRGGVHFVRYLDPGHYYGIDISQDLLDAGYAKELPALGLQERLPRENLACNADFSASPFGVTFDVALAQSVFTHLPLNHMKLCMARAAGYVTEDGVFYATAFLSPPEHDWTKSLQHPRGGVVTHPERNPYHYQEADLHHCIAGLPWRLDEIVNWNHPRDQMMVVYRRTVD